MNPLLSDQQILRIAGAELIDLHGREPFAVGQHAINADVRFHLLGTVEQAESQLITPTVQIPLLPVLALVAERGGVAAKRIFDLVVEAAEQAATAGEPVGDFLEHSKAALRVAKERVLARLDKVERAGQLRRLIQVTEIAVDGTSFTPDTKRRRGRR